MLPLKKGVSGLKPKLTFVVMYLFLGNMNIYLHFVLIVNAEMA